MTHADLASAEKELAALDELHAVTVELDPGRARELASAVTAACTSTSLSARNPAPARMRHGSEAIRNEGHGALLFSSHRSSVGLGVAARFGLPGSTGRAEAARRVSGKLASIPCSDPVGRPGSVTTAFGALPFDPSAPAELVVPELTIVTETGGRAWMTLVGTGDLEPSDFLSAHALRGRLGNGTLGDGVSDRPTETAEASGREDREGHDQKGGRHGDPGEVAFIRAVRKALLEIEGAKLEKVVLARKVEASFDRPIDLAGTLARLRRREPSSTVFAVTSGEGMFIGASPEVLVARDLQRVLSVPLAGTVETTGDSASDALAVKHMVESTKENLEHRLVVEGVCGTLSRFCEPFEVPAEPEVIWLRQVAHLATRISALLAGDPQTWPSALELAVALHPTPAVGGSPTTTALELIRALEPEGRGRYAGPVGWVDAAGNGEFVIGIRSAEVHGSSASVYAGAGIVAGSDPELELDETTVKLGTMLGALACV